MQKRWVALVGALGGVCIALAAYAGAGVNNKVTAATITGTSGNCLAQNNFRVSLTLDASAATANLGYCEGACTAVIGATGTTTLLAGATHYWPAESAPNSAFCFISASGSQPLTIREGFK